MICQYCHDKVLFGFFLCLAPFWKQKWREVVQGWVQEAVREQSSKTGKHVNKQVSHPCKSVTGHAGVTKL